MMSVRLFMALFLSAGVLAACGGETGSDHAAGGHDHGSGAGHGDHGGHGGDHGDHGPGGVTVTDFTPQTELFVEYPALAVGRESPFAAHFTRLSDFKPIASGQAVVRLSGGGAPEETFEAGPAATAGIFRPVAKPEHAVRRRLTVELKSGDLTSVHDLSEVQVYPTAKEADAALPHKHAREGLIPFLKEQQWKVDFATTPAVIKSLSRSVSAPGVLAPGPGGEAFLVAPTDGLVLIDGGKFPEIGDEVKAGQIIARLSPHLGGEQDYAELVSERESAQAAYEAARKDRGRVQRLLKEGAVSERRLEEAQAAEQTAKARLDAAKARLDSVHGTASEAGFAIRAPVSGRIAHIAVGRGQFVNQGDALFRIVDTGTLRLTAEVAEIDAIEMGTPTGAWFTPTGTWFTPSGSDKVYEIDKQNGKLVAAGGAVDPKKRTVPVVFEFTNEDGAFRAGMNVSAHVRTGKAFAGPAIPASAVVDDAGQDVVFVMADGENWERRVVQIAVRDGDWVGLSSGVTLGERVVSRGAWLVHLAASGPAEAGHGHAH